MSGENLFEYHCFAQLSMWQILNDTGSANKIRKGVGEGEGVLGLMFTVLWQVAVYSIYQFYKLECSYVRANFFR